MRIATWNIGEDETNNDGKLDMMSYEYIIRMIKKEKIDILCLQEAIIKSDYLPSISDYIKNNTELKYNIQYELSDSHINTNRQHFRNWIPNLCNNIFTTLIKYTYGSQYLASGYFFLLFFISNIFYPYCEYFPIFYCKKN